MWMGLIPSVEGLPVNRMTSLKGILQKGILPEHYLQTYTAALPWGSSLPAYPAKCGLACQHSHMNQFLKINLCLCVSQPYSPTPLAPPC